MFGLGCGPFIATPQEVWNQLKKESHKYVKGDGSIDMPGFLKRMNDLEIRYFQLNNY